MHAQVYPTGYGTLSFLVKRDRPVFGSLKFVAPLLLLTPLAMAETGTVAAVDDTARANALTQQLGARLKTALETAMQQGGPMAAITVCRDQAQVIAADVSRGSGWTVRRTALRVRNPANAPDVWEQQVLASFAAAAQGADIGTLTAQATDNVTAGSEGRRWRYMKAIPTGQVCTVCHGSNIDPALAAAIKASYPEDQATGFAPGSLRGAFSVSRFLP